YRRVLAAVPGFVPALINLANICRQSDRCDEAEELLARALREEPGDPVVLLHLAVLRAQQEAYREAEAILNSLNPAELPRDLRPSYYGLAGHVALQLDQPNAAVAALRRGQLLVAGVRIEAAPDRKSTRLNSSHVKISYAGFCVKKKK